MRLDMKISQNLVRFTSVDCLCIVVSPRVSLHQLWQICYSPLRCTPFIARFRGSRIQVKPWDSCMVIFHMSDLVQSHLFSVRNYLVKNSNPLYISVHHKKLFYSWWGIGFEALSNIFSCRNHDSNPLLDSAQYEI